MLKHVPMECGFALPEVKQLFSGNIDNWEVGKDFISAQIERLAGFMGCNVPGDVREVAEKILDSFGGLSPLDFIRFFEYCREGKFRKEFQHVSVRGINAEFLFDWLDDYCSERETVWLSLSHTVKQKAAQRNQLPDGFEGVQKPESIARDAAKLALLEHDAHMRRVNFERGLTQWKQREIWFKDIDVETEFEDDRGNTRKQKSRAKVVCDSNDVDKKERDLIPYESDKPGASYKRLFLFAQNFVTLHDDPKPFIDKLIEVWKKTHHESGATDVTWEEYARAEATRFVRGGYQVLKKIGGAELIRCALSKKHGRPAFEFVSVSREVIDGIKNQWAQYLELTLQHDDGIPMAKDEFEIHQSLVWIKSNGLELPIDFEAALAEKEI